MAGCRIENPKLAVLLLTFYAFTSGCLSTYLVSMISTLEKRFEWPTSRVGWLLSADDVGYLSTVLLVAYYGGKGRQSLVLSLSAFFLFVAAGLRALPFLVFGPKFRADQIRGLNFDDQEGNASSSLRVGNSSSESLTDKLVPNLAEQQVVSFAIQFAGGVVQGVAATPFWNVGMALVDDMAGRNSGVYMGFLFLIRTMSPIVGFLFGSFLITVNEDLTLRPEEFPQGLKDPMWIGAWWVGLVVAGCVVLLNTPLLALLDVKKLRAAGEADRAKGRSRNQAPAAHAPADDETAATPSLVAASATTPGNADYLGSMTSIGSRELDMQQVSCLELVQFLKKLYSNTVFLFLYLGTIFEFAAFIILIGYFPKFIESHFYVNANKANIMSSVSLAGASALAIIISSSVSKLFPMSVTHMNLYHAVVNAISALAFPLLFLFRCDKVDMVGPHNYLTDRQLANMSCYDPEACQKYAYNPVCVGGRSYMTPCLAGCTKLLGFNGSAPQYVNCLCSNESAEAGICAPQCSNVYAYLILFFIIRVIGTVAAVQFTLILMKLPRSRELKPLAMGSISFLFGLLGMITPPIAGRLIDTVCIVQNPSSSGRSFCLFYDTDRFRYLVHGIGSCFQVPSCLLFFLSYWLSRTRYPVDKDEVTLQKRREAAAKQAAEEELARLPASG